jgi:hypothetical protein
LRLSLSNAEETTQLALRSVRVATVGILVLAIISSWLAVSLARFPKNWLTTPHIGVVTFVLILTFVVPTVVSMAICYSVASTEKNQAPAPISE